MEENITTTLADFWVTETTFYQEGYYTDYITNQKKRITTDLTPLVGEAWWQNYATIYKQYRDNGKLIFRAKAIALKTVNNATPTGKERIIHKLGDFSGILDFNKIPNPSWNVFKKIG